MNWRGACANWRKWIVGITLTVVPAFVVGGWVVSGGQESPPSTTKPQSPLHFDTPDLHIGEVCSGVPLTCQFAFCNLGPNTVELVEARPGCGCLLPRLEKRIIAPGQRGSLSLDVKTLGQAAGPHTWHLTMVYRDGAELRQQDLQITGTVVTEVSVQPAALTLFTEKALSYDITITDLRQTPLQILAVESTSPQLRAEAGPFALDVFGHFTSKIHLQSAGELAPGRHNEQLVIHTNDPRYQEFTIPLTIVKQTNRRITATPSEPTLRSTTMVRLHDQQDQQVVVESVASDNPLVICKWAPGPDCDATVQLQLETAKGAGDRTGATVRVQISSPLRDVLTLKVDLPSR